MGRLVSPAVFSWSSKQPVGGSFPISSFSQILESYLGNIKVSVIEPLYFYGHFISTASSVILFYSIKVFTCTQEHLEQCMTDKATCLLPIKKKKWI